MSMKKLYDVDIADFEPTWAWLEAVTKLADKHELRLWKVVEIGPGGGNPCMIFEGPVGVNFYTPEMADDGKPDSFCEQLYAIDETSPMALVTA